MRPWAVPLDFSPGNNHLQWQGEKQVSICLTRFLAGVSSPITHWSIAVSPPPPLPPLLLVPRRRAGDQPQFAVVFHSLLSCSDLRSCLPAGGQLVPCLCFLFSYGRCPALTFCSGFWVVRSGPSSSSLGRQPFFALLVAHIVIVRTFILRETDIFYLLGVLQTVT